MPKDSPSVINQLTLCQRSDFNSKEQHFNTYVDEANFGFELLEKSIGELKPKSRILEIGAGISLLSHYLATLGHTVVAIEPSSQGFSRMSIYQDFVKIKFRPLSMNSLTIHDCKLEDFITEDLFDLVFSINVLEHLPDPAAGLERMAALVKPEGLIRVICPNYSFPYDGHFNIPTILTKRITGRIFQSRIARIENDGNDGLWESINWISARKIRNVFRNSPHSPSFSRFATKKYLARIKQDKGFAERKGEFFSVISRMAGLLSVILPLTYAPLIDCYIRRKE